ncbi:MAG: hypothetical protein ACKOMW_07595 [Actinomycetes bacterium]
MIKSVLALGFESDKFNWSDISPLSLEQKEFTNKSEEDVNKAIDANISLIGIYLGDDIVKASGLIGAFYSIDAASLLGKSSVGQDQIWIENATKLRDLLRQTRNLKSEQEQLLTTSLGQTSIYALKSIIAATERKTKVILVGPGAIALGFLALRGNSKIKDYLLIANTPHIPAIVEAHKYMGCKIIMNTKENIHPLAELALSVGILKASEL